MKVLKLLPENEILTSARKIFLLYGFHGATIQKIADDAGVSKSAVHYYFRSKEKLYQRVIDDVVRVILNNHIRENQAIVLFIVNEMHNNQVMFINALNESMPADWQQIIKSLISSVFSITFNEEVLKILFKKAPFPL
jgi:AcrR family transcriptional regulator